jgi:hypothetical protein
MLYCLKVREDSVNRPERGVEWRRIGRTMWASEQRMAPFLFGSIEDRTFHDAPLHFSRNSRSFNVRSFSSDSATELCQTSRGSAVCRSRLDSPSLEGGHGLRRPIHEPAGNRTA